MALVHDEIGAAAPWLLTNLQLKGEATKLPEVQRRVSSHPVRPGASDGDTGDLDRRFQLLRSVGEECQTEPELRELLVRKKEFILYDGFEPSGRMHIAQGLFKAINVNKCTEAGGIFKFYVADWFGLMNDKMGGDLKKIQDTGLYFVHVWKSCGMKMENVRFIWTSQFIEENATEYWTKMLDISRVTSLVRVKRCCTIMGREEGNLTAAQILYPLMQCTDIFLLRADICQLGLDQRKVNMQAREYCGSVGIKHKPIILSHHMMMGLKAGQAKMSKSDPDSAVFMEDTPEDVRRKITNAACPREKEKKTSKQNELSGETVGDEWVLNNPDTWFWLLVCLEKSRRSLLSLNRLSVPEENAKGRGTIVVDGRTYDEADSLESDFVAGQISEKGTPSWKDAGSILLRRCWDADGEVAMESKVRPTPLRSLRVLQEGMCRSLGVVFAPRPGPDFVVTAEAALAAVRSLVRAKNARHDKLVLWCEDWSAIALDQMNGDLKAIGAYYGILAEAVKALAKAAHIDFEVRVQSAEILRDPNMYWISVIDAGRRKRVRASGEEPVIGLEEVAEHLPEGETLAESGQVVATLMHVADVVGLCRGVPSTTIYAEERMQKRHQLAKSYVEESFGDSSAHAGKVCVPAIDVEKARLPSLSLILGEGESIWNGKMKKSYCLEGDVENNPLMDLLDLLLKCELLDTGKPLLEVRQKAEHGGDKDYTSLADVETAFASKELHPSAFKPAVQDRAKAALAPLVLLPKDAAFKRLDLQLELFPMFLIQY
ncbi:unnamed protein product [Symbiodinium natans]|uniref:tyrosine--tRNA ligase n=1 Tax=Symbiodinium natans TaxID=878477 RepID=A0A812LB13_9DINO|nr:unnamed protein product [Symbiodinium natans]